MGFDLSGMNPNMTRPQPELPPFPERTDKDWEKYHDWQEENCGTYFRNNVWWWRPLWLFVTGVCDDILTENDCQEGTMNNCHRISKTKADRIAKRLHRMIEDGSVKEYEEGYKEHLASLEQVSCDTCDGSGMRNDEVVQGKCNGCNGTGKKDDWAKSYPFEEENVRKFANFCANSGGFRIC